MKKNIIKSFIFITIFCLAITGVSLAKTGEIKDSDFLNLREKPTTDSEILVRMPQDAKFEILDDSDYWYRVQYQSYTGYVNGEYVKISSEQTTPNSDPEPTTPESQEPQEPQTIENPNNQDNNTKKSINKNSDVYSLPLLNSIKIGTVSTNNEVNVISTTGKWAYVQNDNISGWVFKSNINGIE